MEHRRVKTTPFERVLPNTLPEERPLEVVTGESLSDESARRLFPLFVAALMLAALVAVLMLWWTAADRIVSRNAMVRSHVSELGVHGEGVIAELLVTAGDRVRAGDVLARLDNSHLQAQRQEIEAALGTLEERVAVRQRALALARERVDVGLKRAQAERDRTAAEARAAQVEAIDAEAFRDARAALAARGGISAEALRDAAAQADKRAALAAAAASGAEASSTELTSAELAKKELVLLEGELAVLLAQRQERLAELNRVSVEIENTFVRAPAAGAIVRRLAQPGMAVETGTPIVSMWLTDDTWVEAWIPEEHLAGIKTGNAVDVIFPALPGQAFTGSLERIGLATDFEMPVDYLPQTREERMRPTPHIGLRLRVDEPPPAMRPGMSAVVQIYRDEA